MQDTRRDRPPSGGMLILCLAPVMIAGLLLYVPWLSEAGKIFLLGVILLAMGIFGKIRTYRQENPVVSTGGRSYSPARSRDERRQVVVIGGGPAGLTAGYELTQYGVPVTVLEKAGIVGGLARTEIYKGYRFDTGGHRFFTKSRLVQRMWEEVLGSEFLRRPRLSRIYFRRKFFDYPLKPLGALQGLGVLDSARVVLSYLGARLLPHPHEQTFEQWVTNRFGKRLFAMFFKSYTEKVWGISCTELRAEWAAQRIKTLTLGSTVMSMFWRPRTQITSLIEQFYYPRLGPGMMWQAVQERVVDAGGEVWTDSEVVRINRTDFHVNSVVVRKAGKLREIGATDFISSMPITELVTRLDPPPPADVLRAAASLRYRDFITVCLIVNQRDLFADNWIYVHDPEIKVSRIQNFKNWSPDMVPDPSTSSLGLEYFCTEGDGIWRTSDAELIELAKREAEQIGLLRREDVLDGCVYRVAKSYPIYDSNFRSQLDTVRNFVDQLQNLQTVGRNGLHRYDNQDHAMLTAMWAVRNLLFDEGLDIWQVNAEQEYHEQTPPKCYDDDVDPAGLDTPPEWAKPAQAWNNWASSET